MLGSRVVFFLFFKSDGTFACGAFGNGDKFVQAMMCRYSARGNGGGDIGRATQTPKSFAYMKEGSERREINKHG